MGDDAAAQVQVGLSLIKKLGSCDKRSRYRALRLLLKRWLPSQPDLTDDMMKKLWKGLFYCFWHADKHSHNLIDRLSSLLPRLHNSSLSLRYFSSFLLTMRRKWPGIDALRLEKFYFFIRRFLHYSFAFLKIHSWDLDLTSRLISLLEDTCFLVKPFGVSYHIASVFLEELEPFLPLQPEVLEVVFKPFISVLGSLPDKVLLRKIKRNMFHELLKMGRKLLDVKKVGDDNDNDDAVVLGTIALTMGFSSKFFELGSSIDSCQGNMNRNRKFLFVLYKEFLKLEKDLESSGIQLSIPIGTDMEVGCGLEKPLKKNVEFPKTKVNGTLSRKRRREMSTKYYDDFYDPDYFYNKCKGRGAKISYCHEQLDMVRVVPSKKKYLPKKKKTINPYGLHYSDGIYWSTKYLGRRDLANIPPTVDEVGCNTVVALKFILSNGEHRKGTVGSGAVISEDGLVLTCAHLLRDFEKPEYCLSVVRVVFFDGQTYEAKVISEDVGKDLALLKIDALGELKLSHATLAMPQKIKTGMTAYLISNPSYFSLTTTTVRYEKRLYRDLELENVLKFDHDTAIIQTNIVSEIGNFGGPLLNSNGEIMGVQFAKTETFKFGIHVESILIFLENNNVVMKKEH